jgi:hypothetical protein
MIVRYVHSYSKKNVTIRAPRQHINVLKLKPACCMLGCMLRVAVMLEIDAVAVQIMVVKGAQEAFGEDIDIHEPVHDTIDTMKAANTMTGYTSPHHQVAAAMFQLLLCVSGIVSLPWLSPTPLATI